MMASSPHRIFGLWCKDSQKLKHVVTLQTCCTCHQNTAMLGAAIKRQIQQLKPTEGMQSTRQSLECHI
jgi:hypothetical protein